MYFDIDDILSSAEEVAVRFVASLVNPAVEKGQKASLPAWLAAEFVESGICEVVFEDVPHKYGRQALTMFLGDPKADLSKDEYFYQNISYLASFMKHSEPSEARFLAKTSTKIFAQRADLISDHLKFSDSIQNDESLILDQKLCRKERKVFYTGVLACLDVDAWNQPQ